MTPETRAARDRIAAFLALPEYASDDIRVLGLCRDGQSHYDAPVTTGELRLVLAALDEQPDQRPVLHAVSGLCNWKTCGHAERAEIYRMIGTCANCQGGPYLMLFTVGHERHALNCPACGTQNVRGTRLATVDEIGAPAPDNESE